MDHANRVQLPFCHRVAPEKCLNRSCKMQPQTDHTNPYHIWLCTVYMIQDIIHCCVPSVWVDSGGLQPCQKIHQRRDIRSTATFWSRLDCKWCSMRRYPPNCLCGDNASKCNWCHSEPDFYACLFDFVSQIQAARSYISPDEWTYDDLWTSWLQIFSLFITDLLVAEECLIDDLIEWMRILE